MFYLTKYVRLCDLTWKERRELNRIVRRQRKMRAPCKDCGDKFFDPETGKSCRKTCERFTEFKQRLEKISEEKQKRNAGTPEICRKVVKQIWKGMKK